MPRPITIIIALFCLTLSFTALPANAAGTNLSIAAEIDALTVAVNRLAVALEAENADTQKKELRAKLDQAISYLSFRSRRIESLERDIVSQKSMRGNIDEILKSLHERIREVEDKRRDSKGGDDQSRELDDLKNQRNMFKDRLARIDENIILTENRINDLQNEISKIESFVQRNLEF